MQEPIIRFEHVSKEFPGVKALDDISFSIEKGEVYALLGENGAGKSTLLNILHGVYSASSGDVYLEGQKVNFDTPQDALKAGIAKVHQEVNLVPSLTVGQNIALGFEPGKRGLVDYKKMYRQGNEILQKLGCRFKAEDGIQNLSAGEMQMIAIAKALYHNAKVISFDEPTASLSHTEIESLFQIIQQLKNDGITILFVSHKLDEVFRMVDRASILRDGQLITICKIAETSTEELIRNMVGRDVSNYAARKKPLCATDEVVLEVEGLTGEGFEDISFKLRKGEILGFAGLVGAGRTEMMRALFGADKMLRGTVKKNGKQVNVSTPEKALQAGIGLLPENRKTQGFIPLMTNSDNMSLAALPDFCKFSVVDKKAKVKNFHEFGRKVHLSTDDPASMTANLSGGNQQKVILAKWLSTASDILIFDEPTKGIDVGAKEEIYGLMEEFVAEGKSIIMISSEMTEVIGMSDRVLVVRHGRITGELSHEEFTEEKILSYAMEDAV